MKTPLFKGVATALYTPFTQNGVDFESLEKLIDRQLNAKIDCLVLLGTTGESPTVTEEERLQLISFAVKKIKGKVPLLVGTGSNDTKRAIELTKQAKSLNADGALIVTPYYNKCEQDGLYAHYEAISNQTSFPFVLYNVPSRTGVNIEPKTLNKLKNLECVLGIKEASKDKNQIEEIFKIANNDIAIYCGNDELNFDFLQRGSSGFISVASNVIPLKIKDIYGDFINNYENKSFENHIRLDKFYRALFSKVNPIPIKAMAQILYGGNRYVRLPLTPANEEDLIYYKNILDEVIK
ncbi:MAG: 4-hydroxy-tetrahydrodipicolinate synthase [Clostridiales bacterium]|nr:4-hydroxy-tetrahydrodipicolinate synthase [Clostridiales bacterium]